MTANATSTTSNNNNMFAAYAMREKQVLVLCTDNTQYPCHCHPDECSCKQPLMIYTPFLIYLYIHPTQLHTYLTLFAVTLLCGMVSQPGSNAVTRCYHRLPSSCG